MVALNIVHASNVRLRELGPGLVALFVGGTSGIGEFTLKSFVQNSLSPRVYLVGRNASAAERIITECAELNKEATVEFLKADVTELKEVDRVCKQIEKKEKRVNLLVQTQGNLNLRGRDRMAHQNVLFVSSENLDRKMVLNHYSRARFVTNLLPLLHTASTTTPHFARTLSVLGAGHESAVNFADLGLESTFSGSRCAAHTIVMNSFFVEELAKKEPGISFLHSSPGVVNTGIARELPFWARAGLKFFTPVLSLMMTSQEETGARQLFLATSGMYPPAKPNTDTSKGVSMSDTLQVGVGSDGQRGSGGYIVNWNGEITGNVQLLSEYREKGVAKTIWERTMAVFQKAVPAQS